MNQRGLAVQAAGLVLLPLLAVMLIGVAGYWPTRHWVGAEGLRAMTVALAVVTAAVYVTLAWAMRRMADSADPSKRFQAALRAAVERFVITLALAGVIAWRGKVSIRVFLIWVALSYVLMIKVETLILILWARRLERRHDV